MLNGEEIQSLLRELEPLDISRLTLLDLEKYYTAIFEVPLPTCGTCRDEAVLQIKKWVEVHSGPVNTDCSYRFVKEHEGKQAIIRIGDNRVTINKNTLNESYAKILLERPAHAGLIERNPDYEPNKKKVVTEIISPVSTSTSK